MITNQKKLLFFFFLLYFRESSIISCIDIYYMLAYGTGNCYDIGVSTLNFRPNWEDTLVILVQLELKSACDCFHVHFYHPSFKSKSHV